MIYRVFGNTITVCTSDLYCSYIVFVKQIVSEEVACVIAAAMGKSVHSIFAAKSEILFSGNNGVAKHVDN